MQQLSTGGGFAYDLLKTTQAWRAEAGAALQPYALTVPQFLVLVELYRPARLGRSPFQQSEVATRLGMDSNTTSQIVRGLEARGVLTRHPHPVDRRARSLELTEAGLELAKASSAAARATNDIFFGQVSDDDQQALSRMLTTLTARSLERTARQGAQL